MVESIQLTNKTRVVSQELSHVRKWLGWKGRERWYQLGRQDRNGEKNNPAKTLTKEIPSGSCSYYHKITTAGDTLWISRSLLLPHPTPIFGSLKHYLATRVISSPPVPVWACGPSSKFITFWGEKCLEFLCPKSSTEIAGLADVRGPWGLRWFPHKKNTMEVIQGTIQSISQSSTTSLSSKGSCAFTMNKDNWLTGQREGVWSQNYVDLWKIKTFSISEPASE